MTRDTCRHSTQTREGPLARTTSGEEKTMTDYPMPLGDPQKKVLCETLGPWIDPWGTADRAGHVSHHVLRDANMCGLPLLGDSEPEKYELGRNPGPSIHTIHLRPQEQCLDVSTAKRNITHSEVDTCSVCRKQVCTAFSPTDQSKFEKLLVNLQEQLGVSIVQTQKERYQCEVDALAQWCIKQGDVISKSGEFQHDRVVPHDTTASIELTVDNPVLKARPDKSSPQHKLDIAEMVEAKLRQGIIEKSSAPWSSNCVVIRKDGKTRIAVDYRKLNEVTIHDSYLLPKISEIYETLTGTEWFTSLDATQAYHQIPMAGERDKDLTSFVTPDTSSCPVSSSVLIPRRAPHYPLRASAQPTGGS